MNKLKIRHFKFAPVIGFGYWYDDYKIMPHGGHCHNLIIPFVRIQWGYLNYKS